MSTALAHPSLSELYAQHRSQALRIARRILQDPQEAEDVVQEVFTRLWSRPGAGFDGRSAFSTWLYRITVNSSINALRARRRRGTLTQLDEPPRTPEDEARSRQARAHFEQAVTELGGRQQQIVWLRELRGFSYPDIAALLGVPEGTVKSTLHRGRARAYELFLKLEGAAANDA